MGIINNGLQPGVTTGSDDVPSFELARTMLRPAFAQSLLRRLRARGTASVATNGGASDSSVIQRWQARLAHDNTFLSYHRNAIISTVAGGALIQYQKGQGSTPLAGTGLLLMGGMYMYVGSALHLFQLMRLRRALRLGPWTMGVAIVNACWPTALWSISLGCLLDETPTWLIESLRRVESHLPGVLQSSLFLDPPALYPVCRLLQGVIAHEELRLATVRRHAAGHWSLTRPNRAPLTDLDVSVIIKRRLERLDFLRYKIDELARSDRAVPTAVGAPLLDKLRVEIEQLENVIEADVAGATSHKSPPVWYVATLLSTEHRRLRDELDDVRRLGQRIAAVRFTSVAFPARGQSGVRPASPEEAEVRASSLLRRLSGRSDPPLRSVQ